MDELKQALISALILAEHANNDLPAAFDKVLGEGAYRKLAGEVYDSLRAPAAMA